MLVFLVLMLLLSLLASILYTLKLRAAAQEAPSLQLRPQEGELPPLSVIIPAYNEAENIEDCVCSVLLSTNLPPEKLEVWVVDDQSVDETWEILQRLQTRLNDPRLKLMAGKPRPSEQVWLGKNWACAQAAAVAQGDYLLFLDADLRVNKGAIATALQFAQQQQIDLFTICPTVVCGCMAEWLAQPLIIHTMLIGFDLKAVNDPASDAAFAAGMFMLFHRAAYEQIGGHTTVADQVVEDVELGRLVKYSGLKLNCFLGNELASVRMYRTWAALWEGWTKNLYAGGQRNPVSMAKFVLVILLMCTIPWVGLFVSIAHLTQGWNLWSFVPITLSLLTIAMHYVIRHIGSSASGIAPRYWWLTGLGGIFVVAIGLTSVLKTETGWGWTWRGRSLKQSN
jgi:cellulose synthase/poly-beta-1,6-N-acetylglucosamine synthase-like glycosyltransferase